MGTEKTVGTARKRAFLSGKKVFDRVFSRKERLRPLPELWVDRQRRKTEEAHLATIAFHRARVLGKDPVLAQAHEYWLGRVSASYAEALSRHAAERARRERSRAASRAAHLRRRARERQATGRATTAEVQAQISAFDGLCAYCGYLFEDIDHFIPLAAGGSGFQSRPCVQAV